MSTNTIMNIDNVVINLSTDNVSDKIKMSIYVVWKCYTNFETLWTKGIEYTIIINNTTWWNAIYSCSLLYISIVFKMALDINVGILS